ncbi:MAG: hypothetical protein IPK00_02660 [Deltaproteobacteria bacterium]|nr:hypothetical protein [Deltaproteobacteria bacterium]
MVYVLGLGCIAWTIFELARLAQPTPSLARAASPTGSQRPSPGPKRVPLAAWDDQGRPICVEDVSVRAAR